MSPFNRFLPNLGAYRQFWISILGSNLRDELSESWDFPYTQKLDRALIVHFDLNGVSFIEVRLLSNRLWNANSQTIPPLQYL